MHTIASPMLHRTKTGIIIKKLEEKNRKIIKKKKVRNFQIELNFRKKENRAS